MKKLTVNEEFIKSVDEELRIEDAFCWEGYASIGIDSIVRRDKTIIVTLKVGGTSMVEHSGDEDGIEQHNSVPNFLQGLYSHFD